MDYNSIAIDGWIVSANVIEPRSDFFGTTYELELQPHSPYELFKVEEKVETLKRMAPPVHREFDDDECEYTHYKDDYVRHCNIHFQSLCKPRVSVKGANCDHELLGKSVTCLGNIQLQKGNNAFISVHEMYEVPVPSTFEDEDYDGPDDDGLF